MGKRQPSPKRFPPDASRFTACVFRTPWGWMGVSETTKGIDAVVLPKASRQAVLSELQSGLSRAAGRPGLFTIARGAGTTDRLSGRDAQVLRSVAGPLTRNEFSAEGLADPSTCLLRPASILSMGGCPCWGQTVCPCRRQCRGGESDADRDSLPSDCGAGYVARRILRRLAHETKTAHSRRNPGGASTGTILARITHERFCCNRRSAACDEPSAGGLAPRNLTVLHEYASVSSGLRALVSRRGSAISRRTVMNNAS